VIHTSALDEISDIAPRVFAPHRTILLGRGEPVRAMLNAAGLTDVTVGYLQYGAEVRMVPEPLSDCYHINLPTRGFTESISGRTSVISTTGRAAVFSPGEPMSIRWSSGCGQLALRLERSALQAELERILNQPVETVRFELGMDVTRPPGSSWLATLRFVMSEVERPDSVVHEPLARTEFGRLLVSTLLFAHRHNYSAALARPTSPARPRAVREVMELIEAHPERPYSASDLAAHANVSLRALQAAFRREHGMSPMAYLTHVRLGRVHADLMEGSPASCSATEVAFRWGFTHLGRFSRAYRQKYGVSPSDTLRRGR
jgi:AraC-like DNA-binding protein